ncbi:PDR/VanB family oxidoreductase [Novosphingobium sp.]|uniref:PDR/VanB family oxidoreductase n=1 Tax=Novosphingobium sp. TaxID=1874826 RepID=UPI00333E7B67
MMDNRTLLLTVADASLIAPGLRRVRLVAADGSRLPPAAPGAHITLMLPPPAGGSLLHNSYTLVSADPDHGYTLIVRRNDRSRGGSHHIHDRLAVGDTIEATVPHNLFALHSQAKKHLLIGGGIGVTPLLAFVAHLRAAHARFELHQIATAGEVPVFAGLLAAREGENIHIHAGRAACDFPALLATQPLGTHVFTCGPAALMDAVEAAAAALGWPASHVHREDFGAAGGEPFLLRLARSGIDIAVAGDQTMLEAIEAAGVDANSLCRGGACGVCLVPVREGTPEHRDHFLSEAERAAGDCVMPCVSRSRSALLVLDI